MSTRIPVRPSDPISLFEIVRAIRESPIFFIFWFLLIFALVIVTYLLLPRKYMSDGRLFVQVGRSSVGASPDATQGVLSLQDSRETEVKSVVAMLQSRELAGRVVDEVGAERIIDSASMFNDVLGWLPSMPLSSSASNDGELSAEEVDEIKLRNKAVKKLMKKLAFEHEKTTTVVTIAASMQNPYLARDVVDAYLKQYQMMHVELNKRQSSDGFFDSQFKVYEQRLEESETELREFRDSIGSLTVDGARGILQQEINQLRLDRVTTEVGYSQAKEKAAQLATQLKTIPALVKGTNTNVSSLARDGATELLFQLQLQEAELSAKLESSNPRLIAIREAIEKSKTEIKDIPTSFKEAGMALNTAHADVVVMFANVSAESMALRKRLETADEAIEAKLAEIKTLNLAEVLGDKVKREIEIQKMAMFKMADKRAESDTIGALDSEHITNVTIAQDASLLFKKIFPSGSMFASFGMVLAAMFATLITFLRHNRIVFPSTSPARSQTPRIEGELINETVAARG